MPERSAQGDRIKAKMVKSLNLAKEAWKEAEMPACVEGQPSDTSKVAIAVLATKIFETLSFE